LARLSYPAWLHAIEADGEVVSTATLTCGYEARGRHGSHSDQASWPRLRNALAEGMSRVADELGLRA
jgi:hypothetical protein